MKGQTWRVWDREVGYGDLLFKRATGDLPEMESSKATAKIIKSWAKPNDSILDVGCGAGHYLKSLKNEIEFPFSYTGVDATANYISLARKAFQGIRDVHFDIADIYELPFADGDYDIVMCCNLLLHLPSIEQPLKELIRVSNRKVLIRTLIGNRSFRIQDVFSPETHPKLFSGKADKIEFDKSGEPFNFGYYNIYSKDYICRLLQSIENLKGFEIVVDNNYDPKQIEAEKNREDSAPDTTTIVDGWQVNGYVLQPWCFIEICK